MDHRCQGRVLDHSRLLGGFPRLGRVSNLPSFPYLWNKVDLNETNSIDVKCLYASTLMSAREVAGRLAFFSVAKATLTFQSLHTLSQYIDLETFLDTR